MAKKSNDNDDIDAFYKAMKDVTPLKNNNKVELKTRQSKQQPHHSARKPDITYSYHFQKNALSLPTVGREEKLSYCKDGIAPLIMRKLRNATYLPIESRLDLHNMTIDQAEEVLSQFLAHCNEEKYRLVLIIHGKGHHSDAPVLKNKINQWLRTTASVLAFCSASQKHGGGGALYVLLSRKEETFD